MKIFFLVLTLLFSANLFSETKDSTKTLMVGDSVNIGACTPTGFKYIQLYKKTRTTNANGSYNKQTGEDFYEYFFNEGDFDVLTLPCEFALKKYRIISLRILEDKNTKADRRVMFLDLGNNLVAWVELDPAVENWEIYIEL